MKDISIKEIVTDRLILKIPTIEEQFTLWNILKDEKVNRYYFPTPDRIFIKYNLSKNNIDDLISARKIFLEQLNDWERQKPFYEKKIEIINKEDNSQKFTWSIYLKTNEVIGQITVQPNDEYLDNPSIRDVGWFINPTYQRQGYTTEAAMAVLDFMFNEVGIERIITSAAICNPGSWKIMEKLGFEKTGEKSSTYLDENNNIVNCYCYNGNKELFNATKNKKLKKI